MIDVHELLRTKENDILRIRKEIEALRVVASLLADSELNASQTEPVSVETRLAHDINPSDENSLQDESQPVEASSESIPPKRTLRDWFSRAAGQ